MNTIKDSLFKFSFAINLSNTNFLYFKTNVLKKTKRGRKFIEKIGKPNTIFSKLNQDSVINKKTI